MTGRFPVHGGAEAVGREGGQLVRLGDDVGLGQVLPGQLDSLGEQRG